MDRAHDSVYAWDESSQYHVDAFVLASMLDVAKPSWLSQYDVHPASQDPKFATSGLDAGYLTTLPGTLGQRFHNAATAAADLISLDQELKDTVTSTELGDGGQLYCAPPPDTRHHERWAYRH